MKAIKLTLFAMLVLFSVAQGFSQVQTLPKVFLLGEFQEAFETASQEHSKTLLEVSSNDMEKAFGTWLDMMKEMEIFSKKIKFDIRGVKLMMHVMWNKDGSIAHIGYHLRPESRNINTTELSAFLSSFMSRYKMPVTSDAPFSQYTGATFPVFVERVNN